LRLRGMALLQVNQPLHRVQSVKRRDLLVDGYLIDRLTGVTQPRLPPPFLAKLR